MRKIRNETATAAVEKEVCFHQPYMKYTVIGSVLRKKIML